MKNIRCLFTFPVGLAALQAVCAPEETDYLFFFFSDDGTYSFSETYEEHQESFS